MVLGTQVCSMLIHGLLPRVLKRAFPRGGFEGVSDHLADDEQEDQDFHKKVKSKIYRCVKWTSDEKLLRFTAATTAVAEPLDHLLQQVQKMSEGGYVLLSLLHDHSNPCKQAQRKYSSMMLDPIDATSWRFLFHFLANDRDINRSLGEVVFRLGIGMSADLWYRCEVFFCRYPFLLVRIIDLASTEAQRVAAAEEFLGAYEGCVDAHIGRKVR